MCAVLYIELILVGHWAIYIGYLPLCLSCAFSDKGAAPCFPAQHAFWWLLLLLVVLACLHQEFGLLAIKLIFLIRTIVDLIRLVVHLWKTWVLSALRPSDFRMIFNKLPHAVRAVALEAPDDVNTDIKLIMDKDEQKESMNSAERGFVLLPPPNLAHFMTKTVLKLSQCAGQWKGISGTSSTKSH